MNSLFCLQGPTATLQNVTNLPNFSNVPNVPTESAKKLKAVRGDFVDGISVANVHALLDRLLDRDVINDDEMSSVRDIIGKKDKARMIIDMVKVKGDKSSSDMIDIVRQLDPNLCENIRL